MKLSIVRMMSLSLFACASCCWSAEVNLVPRELFQIPFGDQPEQLGTRIDHGEMLIPRDFTLDQSGHFYINDSAHHRVVRYTRLGRYDISFRYPETAKQVFSQTDSHENLWLLISDPTKGLFYGVYDPSGKSLRQGVFRQYDRFHLHVDDDGSLHVLLSSATSSAPAQPYLFDEATLLLKHETIARPPENHHQIRHQEKTYYTDSVPGGLQNKTPITRITDAAHHGVAAIEGDVIYITAHGDLYTRVSARELHIYNADGALEGKVHLEGLTASCETLRFDNQGNIYQLDGIPDPAPKNAPRTLDDQRYSGAMPGMRMVKWEKM